MGCSGLGGRAKEAGRVILPFIRARLSSVSSALPVSSNPRFKQPTTLSLWGSAFLLERSFSFGIKSNDFSHFLYKMVPRGAGVQ